MRLPKALRSFTYSAVTRRIFSIAATAPMAMISRSCASCCINWIKPLPSAEPSRLALGTRTSEKKTSAVSAAFWPSFSRLRPRVKPPSPSTCSVSTMISETPLAASLGSVLATRQINSAVMPLERKVFWPLIT